MDHICLKLRSTHSPWLFHYEHNCIVDSDKLPIFTILFYDKESGSQQDYKPADFEAEFEAEDMRSQTEVDCQQETLFFLSFFSNFHMYVFYFFWHKQ